MASKTLKEMSAEVTSVTQTLMEKLSCIQNELKAPKNQWNDYGKYKYRNCEDILEALKPICKKYRTTLIINDDIQVVGTRTYVIATATLYEWDTGEKISTNAYARESENKKGMDDSQITGSTSSYARKYALNGLFNIDDTKDADADTQMFETKDEPSENQNTIKNTKQTIMDLMILWGKQRKRMEELDINYRSPALSNWFIKATGSDNQEATEDIAHMKKLTTAYQALIDNKEKTL